MSEPSKWAMDKARSYWDCRYEQGTSMVDILAPLFDAARVDGARLALERAANLVEEHAARAHRAANAYGDEDATALMTERRERAIAYEQAEQMIRALDPATVAKGGTP